MVEMDWNLSAEIGMVIENYLRTVKKRRRQFDHRKDFENSKKYSKIDFEMDWKNLPSKNFVESKNFQHRVREFQKDLKLPKAERKLRKDSKKKKRNYQ